MIKYLSRRQLSIIGLVICVAVLCTAYFLETQRGVVPCPLCLLQRFVYFAMGFIFLLGAFEYRKACIPLFCAFSNALLAMLGAGLAMRLIWLQHLPKDQVPTCTASLERLFQVYPTLDALKKIFAGASECAMVPYQFYGLGLAEWSLVTFAFLFILCIYCRCAVRADKGYL